MNAIYTNSQAELIANGSQAQKRDGYSAVSWSAVLAGATAAAALSLILLILGVGLGLSTVSPWASSGVSATTFGVSTIAWLTLVQIAASGMGGYLAGRLRAKWVSVHSDETYFRDTAHGFLAWGVATLVTATVLASAVGNIVGGAAQTGASLTAGVAGAASTVAASTGAMSFGRDESSKSDASGALGYWVDGLFRRTTTANTTALTSSTMIATREDGLSHTTEATRILATSVANSNLTAEDAAYLAQLVSQATGLSQADAQTRVTQTFNSIQTKLQTAKDAAQKTAEAARKTSAYGSLWLFVSLLIGAFVASFAATLGGRQRDI